MNVCGPYCTTMCINESYLGTTVTIFLFHFPVSTVVTFKSFARERATISHIY